MATKIFRSGGKFCFKDVRTGEKICSNSEHEAIAARRARHAPEGEKGLIERPTPGIIVPPPKKKKPKTAPESPW